MEEYNKIRSHISKIINSINHKLTIKNADDEQDIDQIIKLITALNKATEALSKIHKYSEDEEIELAELKQQDLEIIAEFIKKIEAEHVK